MKTLSFLVSILSIFSLSSFAAVSGGGGSGGGIGGLSNGYVFPSSQFTLVNGTNVAIKSGAALTNLALRGTTTSLESKLDAKNNHITNVNSITIGTNRPGEAWQITAAEATYNGIPDKLLNIGANFYYGGNHDTNHPGIGMQFENTYDGEVGNITGEWWVGAYFSNALQFSEHRRGLQINFNQWGAGSGGIDVSAQGNWGFGIPGSSYRDFYIVNGAPYLQPTNGVTYIGGGNPSAAPAIHFGHGYYGAYTSDFMLRNGYAAVSDGLFMYALPVNKSIFHAGTNGQIAFFFNNLTNIHKATISNLSVLGPVTAGSFTGPAFDSNGNPYVTNSTGGGAAFPLSADGNASGFGVTNVGAFTIKGTDPSKPWVITTGSNAYNGVIDHQMYIGYNIGTSGNRDTNAPTLVMGFEKDYDAGLGHVTSEWWLSGSYSNAATAGWTPAIRPIQVDIYNRGTGAGSADVSLQGNVGIGDAGASYKDFYSLNHAIWLQPSNGVTTVGSANGNAAAKLTWARGFYGNSTSYWTLQGYEDEFRLIDEAKQKVRFTFNTNGNMDMVGGIITNVKTLTATNIQVKGTIVDSNGNPYSTNTSGGSAFPLAADADAGGYSITNIAGLQINGAISAPTNLVPFANAPVVSDSTSNLTEMSFGSGLSYDTNSKTLSATGGSLTNLQLINSLSQIYVTNIPSVSYEAFGHTAVDLDGTLVFTYRRALAHTTTNSALMLRKSVNGGMALSDPSMIITNGGWDIGSFSFGINSNSGRWHWLTMRRSVTNGSSASTEAWYSDDKGTNVTFGGYLPLPPETNNFGYYPFGKIITCANNRLLTSYTALSNDSARCFTGIVYSDNDGVSWNTNLFLSTSIFGYNEGNFVYLGYSNILGLVRVEQGISSATNMFAQVLSTNNGATWTVTGTPGAGFVSMGKAATTERNPAGMWVRNDNGVQRIFLAWGYRPLDTLEYREVSARQVWENRALWSTTGLKTWTGMQTNIGTTTGGYCSPVAVSPSSKEIWIPYYADSSLTNSEIRIQIYEAQ